jgi:uncharacterized protein YkwD
MREPVVRPVAVATGALPYALAALIALVTVLTGCGADTMNLTSARPGRTGAPADGAAPVDPAPSAAAGPAASDAQRPGLQRSAPPVADPGSRTTPATSRPPAKPATAPPPKVSAMPTGGQAAAVAALTLGPGTESPAEAEVVRLVNQVRVDAGCQPLTVHPVLVMVARAHSDQMAAPEGFRHNSADGLTPFQRMTAAGYRYSIAAENIAAGQSTAAAVVAAWMASPGHRANILDCRLAQIGVGMISKPGTEYGTYWTQDFATPMTSATPVTPAGTARS